MPRVEPMSIEMKPRRSELPQKVEMLEKMTVGSAIIAHGCCGCRYLGVFVRDERF